MKKIIVLIFIITGNYLVAQEPIPATDSTKWTVFRDDYYNPNIDTITKKFDSIYNAFIFRLDSTISKKLLVVDSIMFSADSIILKGTIDINDVIFDTVRFLNGTKQTTAFSP